MLESRHERREDLTDAVEAGNVGVGDAHGLGGIGHHEEGASGVGGTLEDDLRLEAGQEEGGGGEHAEREEDGPRGGRDLGPDTSVEEPSGKKGEADDDLIGGDVDAVLTFAELREMALAHAVGNKVEAAYRRGDMFDKRRRLMDAWAQFAQTEYQIKSDNIVNLSGASS